jgi:hypothetical protein
VILLTSAYQVARITGVSHWFPLSSIFECLLCTIGMLDSEDLMLNKKDLVFEQETYKE